MEQKHKALKSAEDVAKIAEFIVDVLKRSQTEKNVRMNLDVPLKQLEDELNILKAYIAEL